MLDEEGDMIKVKDIQEGNRDMWVKEQYTVIWSLTRVLGN